MTTTMCHTEKPFFICIFLFLYYYFALFKIFRKKEEKGNEWRKWMRKHKRGAQRNSSWIVNPFRSTAKKSSAYIHTHDINVYQPAWYYSDYWLNSTLSLSLLSVYIVHTRPYTPPSSQSQSNERRTLERERDEIPGNIQLFITDRRAAAAAAARVIATHKTHRVNSPVGVLYYLENQKNIISEWLFIN